MTIPKRAADYKTQTYWNSRFQTEDSYEWMGSFDAFAADLCSLLEPEFSILVLGCGSSSLSYDLYQRGYHKVTSIDFSDVAIDNMKRRYASVPCLKWVLGDVRELPQIFECDQFDVVVDKGLDICEN
ncbi:Endothelin-converting enzyme 2 [Galdieria sulphuraria]|nr:Endothelin-converting enzyme 2 [Galdieria sulphuraria]